MIVFVCPVCKQDACEIGCDLDADDLTGNTVAVMALHPAIDSVSGDYIACDGYGCRPEKKEVLSA